MKLLNRGFGLQSNIVFFFHLTHYLKYQELIVLYIMIHSIQKVSMGNYEMIFRGIMEKSYIFWNILTI